MGKVKTLEKKIKPKAEFDTKNPESRKKSLNDVKLKTKLKAKKEVNAENNIQKTQKKKKLKILQQIKKEVEENKTKPDNEPTDAGDKLVKREIIKKAVIALKDGITKEIEANEKKNLFDEELRLGLQIVASKIPQCPPHVRKILLDHSLFDQSPDVCFFIKDEIPKKGDQDENIRNFQEKLKAAEIENVKTIMPISQLKTDYKSHNLKLKLCNTYDIFLVESEIAEHVYSLLGKHFIVKRKRPLQIDTKKDKVMKISIENAIKKVSFKLNSNSNLSCFEVGTIKMDNIKIADNISTGIDQLKEKWPGSWKNISRLYLKPMKPSKVTIPIYYSNVNPNDIEVPVIHGAKQNRLDKLAEELKKKSKKLKIDLKKKRLVKNLPKSLKPPAKEKQADKVKSKNKKEKPKKSVKAPEKKEVDAADNTVQKGDEEPAKKKKNKKVNVVEQPKKQKKAAEPETEPAKKKKKKQNSEPKVDASEAKAVEKPALEKKKNKNKNKSADMKKDDTAPIVSQQDQISIKKKKKDKKNKA